MQRIKINNIIKKKKAGKKLPPHTFLSTPRCPFCEGGEVAGKFRLGKYLKTRIGRAAARRVLVLSAFTSTFLQLRRESTWKRG